MAYDWWFRMYANDRALDASDVCRDLTRQFDVHQYGENDFGTTDLEFSIRQSGIESKEAYRANYSGVHMCFRSARDSDTGEVTMMQIVNWLLGRYDAAVDFQGDYGHLILFKDEKGIVLVDSDFWTCDPRIRPAITVPYVYRNAAIDHWLKIRFAGASPDPMVLRGFLMAKFALSPDKEYHDRAYCKELAVQILKSDDEVGAFHVHCEVNVLHYHAAIAKMLAIYRGLLDKFPDDVVMTWDPERAKHGDNAAPPLLTRTAGQITLADEPDFWTPERKAIFLAQP